MLRFVIFLLILLNGLYFSWSQGYLEPYGWPSDTSAEPERLKRQILPEAIRISPVKPSENPS